MFCRHPLENLEVFYLEHSGKPRLRCTACGQLFIAEKSAGLFVHRGMESA